MKTYNVILLLLMTLMFFGCAVSNSNPANSTAFQLTAKVSDQPMPMFSVSPGQTGELMMKAGQAIELTSSDNVEWLFKVGNNTVRGNYNTINFDGVIVKETGSDKLSWTAETSPDSDFSSHALFSLVVTSLVDQSQVAIVNITLN